MGARFNNTHSNIVDGKKEYLKACSTIKNVTIVYLASETWKMTSEKSVKKK